MLLSRFSQEEALAECNRFVESFGVTLAVIPYKEVRGLIYSARLAWLPGQDRPFEVTLPGKDVKTFCTLNEAVEFVYSL